MNVDHRCDMDIFTTHYGGISRLIIGYIMLQKFLISVVVFAFSHGVFAAGLVVPEGGIALGEVQPGEAVDNGPRSHKENDVEPFEDARNLDQHCGSGYVSRYYEVRPTW